MTLQAGFDPLFRAISEGDLDTLEHLFCTGKFSVNEEVYYYSEDDKTYIITPLYWAVKLEKTEICGYLLQNGADPYRHTVYEYYPLHEACNKGNSGIVQEFIDANCNPNKPNCDGDTPLHIACLRGHKECIRLLLSAGASRNERNNKGQTPLQVAQFDQQTELYRLFQKDFSPSRVRVAAGMKQAPPICGRRRSLTSAHYSKLTRPLSYHAHDDASVNRLKSLRSDVTRTFSFSGTNSNHYPYYHDNRALKDSSIVTHSRKDSPSIKTPSQRPSLSYMSHDSQLVLPTQVLIPDPRRTQTCHEFKSLPVASKLDHRLKTPSPDPSPSPEPPLLPDDVEADAIHPRQSNTQSGRVRINHMVQCMQQALKSRDASDSLNIHNDCLLKVLFSIHKEVGYSDEDYSAINRLVTEREEACSDRPSSSGQMGGELEYVWGCDYELVQRHPLLVERESPESSRAEMTFHVRLINEQHVSHKGRESFLKVIVQLFNLDEAGQFEVHNGNHDDQSKEGRVLSSLPPHPNIVKWYHHCLASSRPFERFYHHFGENDSRQKFRLSPQCSLLFTEYFSNSLEDLVNVSHECSRPATRFCTSEKTLLHYLAQLLLAIIHIDSHNIILGCISASKVFVDKNHLYFADFSFAHDLKESSDKASLKNWLETVSEEALLKFPPELCEINDTQVSLNDSNNYKRSLKKCNVYSIGIMFKQLITASKSTSRNFYEFAKISEHFKYLLEKMVCDYDHRLSSIEAAMFCLSLLYGPSYDKCNTLEDCQEWLITETFHLFLQPSLKGHPASHKPDVQTKLLFAYLSLATPERLLAILEMQRELAATK